MTRKPDSVEMGFLRAYSTKEDMPAYLHPRHEARISKLIDGKLTTDGIQWSAVSCSTGASAVQVTVGSTYTVKWPGLEGYYVDELECGLTCGIRGSTSTAGASTVGYSWQYKDDSETTWQNLTTFKTFKASSLNYTERTVSGYASLGTGYNKLPLEIRLRAFSKSANKKTKFRIKSSSYVAIMPKKST